MKSAESVFKPQVKWDNLHFYRKTVVLHGMTVVFCRRFLPKYGDRTVDQMVQAARSGKQNIVEGLSDGVTSTEIELKLLNVARGSLRELQEDYRDYLRTRGLVLWDRMHPRFDGLLAFCRMRNGVEEYSPFFERWSAEEFANCAITLCCMVDRMLNSFLRRRAREFMERGGIRERMTAARLGRRQEQHAEIAALKTENANLRSQVVSLVRELGRRGGAKGV